MAIPMQAPLQTAGQGRDWSTLRGATLEGGYELKEILSAEADRATFRVRVLGDYSLRATAAFYALSGTAASEQVGCWEVVRRLDRSASVRRPLGTGLLSVNGLPAAYAVLPETEETLADALNLRALSGEEAREVLRSAARGLTELHAAGLVHGCISPEQILATNDAILLSGESIRSINSKPLLAFESKYLAPESERENITTASDVWCLGATLVEALTQKAFDRSNDAVVETLEHPFDLVARCCLEPDPDLRCKPGDLPALMSAPKPARSPVQAIRPVETQKAVATPTAATPALIDAEPKSASNGLHKSTAAKSPVAPFPLAASNGTAAAPAPIRNLDSGVKPAEQPKAVPAATIISPRSTRPVATAGGLGRGWLYALVGAAIVVLLFLLLRSQRTSPQPSSQPGPTPAATVVTPPVATPGTSWPTKTLGPPSANAPMSKTPVKPPAISASAPVVTNSADPANWRVVLFTFNRQQDAETRAAALNAKHPGLNASTFSPSGSGSPYLVVSGSPVTRAAATRLRLQALRSGMPRDTYIQNFRQ